MRIRCIFHEIKDRLVTILKLVNVHLKFSQFRYLLIDNFNSIFNFKLLALYFGYINATKFAYTLLITIHA